jgi:hypothetical protein
MKIIEVAFIMLVFNICMGAVTHSLITPYPLYYETEFINIMDPDSGRLPANISTVSETQQYSTTMDVVDIVMSVTDFGWLDHYVPAGLKTEAALYILGLQAIVGFFYAIAIIELFVKQFDILGGK